MRVIFALCIIFFPSMFWRPFRFLAIPIHLLTCPFSLTCCHCVCRSPLEDLFPLPTEGAEPSTVIFIVIQAKKFLVFLVCFLYYNHLLWAGDRPGRGTKIFHYECCLRGTPKPPRKVSQDILCGTLMP